jgi:3alpha(or 20beta)-hydroxysteroid dehydrogenase
MEAAASHKKYALDNGAAARRIMDFSGKTVLVTGGARGIGAEIARAFHAHGAAVAVADILLDQGAALAAAAGERMRFFALDVRHEAEWEQLFDQVIAWTGGCDILVNNAGIEETQRLVDVDIETVKRLIDVNVCGVILGMKWGLRVMQRGGRVGRGGSIINLSSIAVHTNSAGMGPYGATKAAVERITKIGAVEAGAHGVRVNCLYPGIIQSDMIEKVIDGFVSIGAFATRGDVTNWLMSRTPLARIGKPDDVANAALFLASDYAAFVNGAGLVVDGGVSLTG